MPLRAPPKWSCFEEENVTNRANRLGRAEIKTGHCLHRIGGPRTHNHPTRRNRQNSAAQVIRISPTTVK
jgi:hypothetical protein